MRIMRIFMRMSLFRQSVVSILYWVRRRVPSAMIVIIGKAHMAIRSILTTTLLTTKTATNYSNNPHHHPTNPLSSNKLTTSYKTNRTINPDDRRYKNSRTSSEAGSTTFTSIPISMAYYCSCWYCLSLSCLWLLLLCLVMCLRSKLSRRDILISGK